MPSPRRSGKSRRRLPRPCEPAHGSGGGGWGSASRRRPPRPTRSLPSRSRCRVASVAAEGDGAWVPVKDGGPPLMYKSLVHPDPKRTFAAVAVVAVDLKRVDLHVVAGTQEPASDKVPAEHRPGIIPKDAFGDLVAAFNGGFKAIHGHYGMMIEGETFIVPRDIGCTVALYKDGGVRIRTWTEVKETVALDARLPADAALSGRAGQGAQRARERRVQPQLGRDGERRDRDPEERDRDLPEPAGALLRPGEAVTAQALARAMRAVGAEDAAQLDVNYSYPRFLFFDKAEGSAPPKVGSALIPGIKYTRTEYVGGPEVRDFFYLTSKRPAS